MDAVSKTLYIPLYGKALVSRKGLFLHDPKAEEIWDREGFPLRGKSASRWLAYYMGMRSAVFDRWTKKQMQENPGAVILHLGCGMDSRYQRVTGCRAGWYDVDFPEVIAERKRYFAETERYHMIGSDVREADWLTGIPGNRTAVIVMEGISMYLPEAQLKNLLGRLCARFETVSLLMDCYTTFAAKASKYKNPINDVGVTQVYGLDDPNSLPGFLREHEMTPNQLIDQLQGVEKRIFRSLYAGGVAKKMYRLYEFQGGAE